MVPAGNADVIGSGGNALIGSFISLLNKYSLRSYYGPGTVDAKCSELGISMNLLPTTLRVYSDNTLEEQVKMSREKK